MEDGADQFYSYEVSAGAKAVVLGQLLRTYLAVRRHRQIQFISPDSRMSQSEACVRCIETNKELRVTMDSSPATGTVAPGVVSLVVTESTSAEELELALDYLQRPVEGGIRGKPPGRGNDSELQFTPREQEILWHVGQGESNSEIARALGISPHTVRTHLRTIGREVGVTGRSGLVVFARSVIRRPTGRA